MPCKRLGRDMLLIALILFLLGAGFIYGYIYRSNSLTESLESDVSNEGKSDKSVIDNIYPQNKAIHMSQLAAPSIYRVRLIYQYEKCNHIVRHEEGIEISNNEITREQLMLKFPNSNILKLSSTEAEIEKTINQYCPQHYILKRGENAIGIYKNEDGTGNLVQLQTLSIQLDSLNDELRINIDDGIPFDSLEEIEAFLEDIDS